MDKIKTICVWFFGVLFIFNFIVYLTENFITSLLSLALSALLIPPFFEYVQKNAKKNIPRNTRLTLIVMLFFALLLSVPNSDKNEQATTETVIPTATLIPSTAPTDKITVYPSPTFIFSPTKKPLNIVNSGNFFRVIKVIDGDTIKVENGQQQETVRFIGIDTPETVDPRKSVQCFGKEASNRTKALLSGKFVRLEADATQGDRDKYNRLLRYVFLEDGTLINKLLIEEGYAHEYTYNIPYQYQSEFKTAQKDAESNKRGLWSDTACADGVKQETSSNKTPQQSSGAGYACNCSKLCSNMTCEEAYYQLQQCGCSVRDADSDGVPCESVCR